ncbi:MAG TPA: exodeoxyribonuclease III, partial [Plasticicumulans sp.]|nr:exodeoxyribonuclease III [Plasticicumulans sp.]
MRKIATWNVNSLKVRLPQVLDWLAAESPDVLALQETKLQDADFPAGAIRAAGYEVVFAGQKTYNGVALLSREPADAVVTELPGLADPQRRVLGATVAGVRVLDLYVPNGQAVGSDKYA